MRRRVLRHRPTIILGGLVFLFLLAYFWPHIFIRIKSGELGVKYRLFAGGTVTNPPYDEGVHWVFPWDQMFIYNVRIQEAEHTVDLLDESGLTLRFLLSIRYHPERDMVGFLHKQVGPDYVQRIVIPQVVGVLRTHVGQLSAEEVFTSQPNVLDQVFSEAIAELTKNYITVNDVIIRTIELPPAIKKAVEDKNEQRHIAEAYEFRILKEQKEAKRKEIEAEGYARYNSIIAETLSAEMLKWSGIQATHEIAASNNSKVIVIGNGENGLPIILGADK